MFIWLLKVTVGVDVFFYEDSTLISLSSDVMEKLAECKMAGEGVHHKDSPCVVARTDLLQYFEQEFLLSVI